MKFNIKRELLNQLLESPGLEEILKEKLRQLVDSKEKLVRGQNKRADKRKARNEKKSKLVLDRKVFFPTKTLAEYENDTSWHTPDKFRDDLIKNQTPAEKLFKAYLKSAGIKYEFQKVVYVDNTQFYILDFFLPEYTIAVELDGGYHFTKEQLELDILRTKKLVTTKIVKDVFRLKNEEVNTSCIDKLQIFLKKLKIGTRKESTKEKKLY